MAAKKRKRRKAAAERTGCHCPKGAVRKKNGVCYKKAKVVAKVCGGVKRRRRRKKG